VNRPESYRIVVNGLLSDRFASAFAGMAIEAERSDRRPLTTIR